MKKITGSKKIIESGVSSVVNTKEVSKHLINTIKKNYSNISAIDFDFLRANNFYGDFICEHNPVIETKITLTFRGKLND